MATVVEQQAPTSPPRYRWTSAEFDRLLAEGFLRDGGPEFLWDGEIISPMSEDVEHANAADNVADAIRSRLPSDRWAVGPSHPLALADGFMPELDVVVARGPRSNYRKNRPTAADTALVVEVANSSWAIDSGEYLRHYALAGIPLYWIIHIKGRRVEADSRPDRDSGTYQGMSRYGLGESVPLVLDGEAFEPIAVEAIVRDSLEG